MTLNDYLSLFPGSTRENSRLMAVASAVLQQVVDLQAVVGEVNAAFAPATALGVQLEALGESLGLSRLDTMAGVAATDEVYRDFIRKKLIRWGWDLNVHWTIDTTDLHTFRIWRAIIVIWLGICGSSDYWFNRQRKCYCDILCSSGGCCCGF